MTELTDCDEADDVELCTVVEETDCDIVLREDDVGFDALKNEGLDESRGTFIKEISLRDIQSRSMLTLKIQTVLSATSEEISRLSENLFSLFAKFIRLKRK